MPWLRHLRPCHPSVPAKEAATRVPLTTDLRRVKAARRKSTPGWSAFISAKVSATSSTWTRNFWTETWRGTNASQGNFERNVRHFSAYRHFEDDSPFGDGSKANFIRITLSDGHGANIHFLLLPISNKFDIKSANRWNWTKLAYQVESSVLSSVMNFSFRNSLKQWL